MRVAGTTPYYGANGIQDYVDGYTHDGEFILVAEDGANDLKNYPVKCVKGRIWVNNHAHVLQGKYDCADNQFLAYAISQADIESLLVGGGRAKLNAETLMGIDLLLPNKAEQIRIGKYLAQLDNLITLHQCKCQIDGCRFQSPLAITWEQRKLGDNIIEYTETTTKNNQYPPLTSSRKGIFLQTEYFAGNQIASDDNTGYNIVPYGYFTYRHMSDDEIFHFNINDIVENGIVSTLYPVFTTDENLDSRYLQYQLNYGYEFAKFAILQKQGGSRTYMYLNKLKQLYLTMPKSVEEQNAISAFFMSLDNLITLHQCE